MTAKIKEKEAYVSSSRSKLQILVESAALTKESNVEGKFQKMDPYATVQVGEPMNDYVGPGHKEWATAILSGAPQKTPVTENAHLRPVWGNSNSKHGHRPFVFTVTEPCEHARIIVDVHDWNRIGAHGHVGRVFLPLFGKAGFVKDGKDTQSSGQGKDFQLLLSHLKGGRVRGSAGSIRLSYQYELQNEDSVRMLAGINKELTELGKQHSAQSHLSKSLEKDVRRICGDPANKSGCSSSLPPWARPFTLPPPPAPTHPHSIVSRTRTHTRAVVDFGFV